MPAFSKTLDCSEPLEAGLFRDFYEQHFYEVFAANSKIRIGVARLAFEAGFKAAQTAPGAPDGFTQKEGS